MTTTPDGWQSVAQNRGDSETYAQVTDGGAGDVFTAATPADGGLVTLRITNSDGDYMSMFLTPAEWSQFLKRAATESRRMGGTR